MKKISINYSETHYFKFELEIDLDVLRKCSPQYSGNSLDEFKKYIWSYVYYGTDTININEEWFNKNESLLKETKLSNGITMYDILSDLDEVKLSDMEEYDFTEHQDLEEEYDSENPGNW